MRGGGGVKQPQEAQKARALWQMKAAKDAGEKYYDPTREDNIGKKQDTISTSGRAPQRSDCGTGQSPEVCGEFVLAVSVRVLCGGSVLQWLAPASSKVCGKDRSGRAFGPAWIQWTVCVYALPGKYGPHGELFFFLIQKAPTAMTGSETFSSFLQCRHPLPPLFSVNVLKKCALIALHVIAEEGRDGDGCRVPGLGDEWKMGCPQSPMWESEGEAWSEDESVSSNGSHKGNMCNGALHVIGLHGFGGKISLFLRDWELTKVALSCHMALDMLCQELHGAW